MPGDPEEGRRSGASDPCLPFLLDWAERLAILALFSWFASGLIESALTGHWYNSLLLFSEAAVIVFVLLRRHTTEVTRRPHEWALAACATAGPLLVQAGGPGPLISGAACGVLMLTGLLLQLSAKLTLARSFGIVPANRGVKRDGPYRFLRHPMYAGYVLTHVGFLLANPTLWNAAVYGASFALQIARILAEERLLAQDPVYRDFQSAVRWRLAPGIF